jgi:hypothetical protein
MQRTRDARVTCRADYMEGRVAWAQALQMRQRSADVEGCRDGAESGHVLQQVGLQAAQGSGCAVKVRRTAAADNGQRSAVNGQRLSYLRYGQQVSIVPHHVKEGQHQPHERLQQRLQREERTRNHRLE